MKKKANPTKTASPVDFLFIEDIPFKPKKNISKYVDVTLYVGKSNVSHFYKNNSNIFDCKHFKKLTTSCNV